jgi:hypothetical protein
MAKRIVRKPAPSTQGKQQTNTQFFRLVRIETDTIDELHRTCDALQAFYGLVAAEGEGISDLLRPHVHSLEAINKTITEAYDAAADSGPKGGAA